MDQSLWEIFTTVMVRNIGDMIQAQQSQQKADATPSAHAGRKGLYSEWALVSLMGYDQVYTEIGMPIIWGRFQIYKEYSDNRQELMTGMTYWAKKNGINIDTLVLFVNIYVDDMVDIKFNPGGPVAMKKSSESGISPLVVIPRTTQDIEEEIRREEASEKSQRTRTKYEASQLEKLIQGSPQ